MRNWLSTSARDIATLGVATWALVGCGDVLPPPIASNAHPAVGKQLVARYGCGSCHKIAGVAGADGAAGPPLTDIKKRGYIAGVLANTTVNLEDWIMHPTVISPATAMPDLGVSRVEARDIAAFLYAQ